MTHQELIPPLREQDASPKTNQFILVVKITQGNRHANVSADEIITYRPERDQTVTTLQPSPKNVTTQSKNLISDASWAFQKTPRVLEYKHGLGLGTSVCL
jgi:hypothetical protein